MLGFFSGGWRMVNEMGNDDDSGICKLVLAAKDAVRIIRHEN